MYYTFGASCSLDLTARTRPFLSFNGKVAEGEERRGRAEWRGKASIEWPYRCQIRRHNRVRPSRNLADYLCIDGAAAAAEWTFTPDIGAHFIHCCPRKKKAIDPPPFFLSWLSPFIDEHSQTDCHFNGNKSRRTYKSCWPCQTRTL